MFLFMLQLQLYVLTIQSVLHWGGFYTFQKFAVKFPAHVQIILVKCN